MRDDGVRGSIASVLTGMLKLSKKNKDTIGKTETLNGKLVVFMQRGMVSMV